MLSLIEVKCPHCGASGQIMVPPLGAIIVGPCPQCSEMVMVFCGRTLALDKAILTGGTTLEKREHVLGVLVDFLSDRVDQLVQQINSASETIMSHEYDGPNPEAEDDAEDAAGEASDAAEDDVEDEETDFEEDEAEPEGLAEESGEFETISENEFSQFVQIDLKLLDNKEYFQSIFG